MPSCGAPSYLTQTAPSSAGHGVGDDPGDHEYDPDKLPPNPADLDPLRVRNGDGKAFGGGVPSCLNGRLPVGAFRP